MGEMVERVALAFAKSDFDCSLWPHESLQELARIAMCAMREPTMWMTRDGQAASRDTFGNMADYFGITEDRARDVYQSMIDAALK